MFYPFILNDPGEGAQAKRRGHAVIIDHLMPPLTRAETYGALQVLERQMDEYYEALSLDPRRATRLRQTILEEVLRHGLHADLGFEAPADEAALPLRVPARPRVHAPGMPRLGGGRARRRLVHAREPR